MLFRSRAAIDVCIADAMTLRTSVKRIDAVTRKKAASPRAIAVHALDLFRASLLEVRKRPQRAQPIGYDHEAHAHR